MGAFFGSGSSVLNRCLMRTTGEPPTSCNLQSRQRPTPLPAAATIQPRRVSEKGTLQLSIDTDSVRRLLLEFPRAACPLDSGLDGEGGSDTASYTHYIEREMGGAVSLVKVLQAKPENLVDTFILLMPPSQRGAADLGRVCELKVGWGRGRWWLTRCEGS